MKRRTLIGLLAAMAVALVGITACGSSSSSSSSAASGSSNSAATSAPKQTQNLTVMLDWVPNPDHLGLYTTLAHGYFKNNGLNVKLQPPSNVTDVAKLVATGNVPIGISYEPDTIIAGASNLPIVAVGALVPVALNSIIAPAKTGITTPAALKGKSVGVSGLKSDDAFLKAITQKAGIPLDSIKKVNVGANLLPSVVSGKVDSILGGYRNVEAVQVRDQGLNPTVIPVTQAGVPPYDELVIIANANKLKSDASYQQLVRNFLASLAKGNALAVAQPAVGIASMKDVIKGYPANQVKQMVDVTAPLLNNPLGFGQMSEKSWQGFANWMLANKLISKAVNVQNVMTDKYLPAG
ncbi:MAG: ABC transporter substrate-binding protein [Solirubrobacteraceae bacterium]